MPTAKDPFLWVLKQRPSNTTMIRVSTRECMQMAVLVQSTLISVLISLVYVTGVTAMLDARSISQYKRSQTNFRICGLKRKKRNRS